MPSFISKDGIWEPAKEKFVNPNAPAGQEIYEGPDRAAVEMLKEQGVESLGQHYSLDSELIMRARQLGFKSVDEYLKMFNYSKERAAEAYEKAKATVVDHKDLPRTKDASGSKGGFGDVPKI